MRQLFTVVDPLGSAEAVEVAVDAPPGTRLTAVRHGLLGAVGRTDGLLYAGQRQLSDDDALGEPPLLEGAVLAVDRPGPVESRGLLELHVVAGPDSGSVHRLAPGEHSITSRAVDTVGHLQPSMSDPDIANKKTYWESNGQVTRRIQIA